MLPFIRHAEIPPLSFNSAAALENAEGPREPDERSHGEAGSTRGCRFLPRSVFSAIFPKT